MTSPIARIRIAAAVALTGAVAPCVSAQKTLLMHYMPWFITPDVRGDWGLHWDGPNNEFDPDTLGSDGLPDIYANYHPLIGLYDSTERDVIECQLLQMKLAGIDGVIPDWYGISTSADYGEINDAVAVLFDEIGDKNMEFAALFEDRTIEFRVNNGLLPANQIQSELIGVLNFVQNTWITQPQYHFRNGEPLFFCFGPVFAQNPADWDAALNPLPIRPDFHVLPGLQSFANADGTFRWVEADPWQNLASKTESQIKGEFAGILNATGPAIEVIASAFPGFDDVYEPGGRFTPIDYQNGATMRQSLEVGMDGPWDTIQLATWNDYTEGTMIEPTFEFGYLFLEVIQQERIEEQGASFVFSPDDLRLPAQLLSLRRAGAGTPAALDTIATLLSNGQVDTARFAIQSLLGDAVTASPEDTIAAPGGTLSFTAQVDTGDPSVAYRWELDGVPLIDDARIAGATTPNLTITGAALGDVGSYRLVATISGALDIATDPAVGAVTGSPFGVADLNNDGATTFADISLFLQLFNAASNP